MSAAQAPERRALRDRPNGLLIELFVGCWPLFGALLRATASLSGCACDPSRVYAAAGDRPQAIYSIICCAFEVHISVISVFIVS